jgi:UDP-3-O-[3-hydroxymyristoyl] glucosamine N-acyltransferase
LVSGRFTLGILAKAVDATLDGDPDRVVTGVASLESAGPDEISFLTDARYHDRALASRAGAFLAPLDASGLPAPTLRARAPQRALIDLLLMFHPPVRPPAGIHPSAVVSPGARIDPSAAVGPLTVVESGAVIGRSAWLHALVYVGADVEIGDESEVYPQVVLREGVKLGRRVIVHAGAVIGADGFGYVQDAGEHRKIPQVGTVLIEDDVEIGANTAVDRATVGATVIRRGTKIDNLVQIAHNVEVGERSIIVAQVGISGSTRLGQGVVLAGQVGVADHVTVGDGAMVGAQSGILFDVAPGEKLAGSPARPILQMKRIVVIEGQLPEMARKVRELERRLERLERGAGDDGANDG